MKPEDGLIWVLGLVDQHVAFTDDGVDSLVKRDQDPPGNDASSADLSRTRQPLRSTPDGYNRRVTRAT